MKLKVNYLALAKSNIFVENPPMLITVKTPSQHWNMLAVALYCLDAFNQQGLESWSGFTAISVKPWQGQGNSKRKPTPIWLGVEAYSATGQCPEAYYQSYTKVVQIQESVCVRTFQSKQRPQSVWESVARIENCCSSAGVAWRCSG